MPLNYHSYRKCLSTIVFSNSPDLTHLAGLRSLCHQDGMMTTYAIAALMSKVLFGFYQTFLRMMRGFSGERALTKFD